MHFNRYIAHWSSRYPDKVALVCEDRPITWREIDERSARIAAFLIARGVEPGDRVGCLLENSIDWCLAFIGAFRAGAIFVPFNRLFGRYEPDQIARDAECAIVVSCAEDVAKLDVTHDADDPRAIHFYDLRDRDAPPVPLADVLAREWAFADHRRSDDDPIAICYTSGTTGIPKGILLTHRSVDTMVQGLTMTFQWSIGNERFVIPAPLAFTGTVICVLCPLLATGGTGFIEKTLDASRALARSCASGSPISPACPPCSSGSRPRRASRRRTSVRSAPATRAARRCRARCWRSSTARA